MAAPVQEAPPVRQTFERIDRPFEWRYEMRRDMQEILPGLWLGPYVCSKNRELLRQRGITHILCLRDATEKYIVKCHFPEEIRYHEIEVSDHPLENLIPHFPAARKFIDSARGSGGRVFVHCNGGISRSPAFVVAYVMESQRTDFQTAFNYVQNRRFCMNPNEGFKSQLKEYEPIFRAREHIQALNYTPDMILRQGERRRAAPEEDGDDEMDEEMG
ncbi:protein-tyrosine phosphatase-like protein [Hyaloraphidium curvatum]|nr:protein-tyrosine phosphatase-like protein [Hyaloraphidium curvatum]